MTDDPLRMAADLVYQGFNLDELAKAPIIDTTVTCPACGHGEAVIGDPAPEGGFFECCCRCGIDFVDSTP